MNMTDDAAKPHPIRSVLSGLLLGAGLTGFMTRGLVEFCLWFGTAYTYARPKLGYTYPVVEHGVTYFVSSAEALLHNLIMPFWLMFAIGLLTLPRRPGADRKGRLNDPKGLLARSAWAGAAITLLFMAAVHVFVKVSID